MDKILAKFKTVKNELHWLSNLIGDLEFTEECPMEDDLRDIANNAEQFIDLIDQCEGSWDEDWWDEAKRSFRV